MNDIHAFAHMHDLLRDTCEHGFSTINRVLEITTFRAYRESKYTRQFNRI